MTDLRIADYLWCLHAALGDKRFDLFGLEDVAELLKRVGDLVASEGEREGVVDEELVGLAKTELERVCVEHLAVDLGSSLPHLEWMVLGVRGM